jgi:hypothetical protein
VVVEPQALLVLAAVAYLGVGLFHNLLALSVQVVEVQLWAVILATVTSLLVEEQPTHQEFLVAVLATVKQAELTIGELLVAQEVRLDQ